MGNQGNNKGDILLETAPRPQKNSKNGKPLRTTNEELMDTIDSTDRMVDQNEVSLKKCENFEANNGEQGEQQEGHSHAPQDASDSKVRKGKRKKEENHKVEVMRDGNEALRDGNAFFADLAGAIERHPMKEDEVWYLLEDLGIAPTSDIFDRLSLSHGELGEVKGRAKLSNVEA
ncbi:hypothetical protein CRG98_014161 [Punica granatum]|nr:hypothetical protein CRG98_014161 [Punica granatum]